MKKISIVMKSVDALKRYENNPRDNVAAIPYVANSIEEFGFKVPIVIDKDDTIIAGHTRLEAAIALGIEEVPCIVADDLTDEQVKAFRLVDNKTHELSRWDFEGLQDELGGIFDLDMEKFGFTALAVPEKEEKKPEKQADEAPEASMCRCPKCGKEFFV